MNIKYTYTNTYNTLMSITNEIIILKIGIDFSRIIENSSGLKKMALN